MQASIQEIAKYHNEILLELFPNESHPIFGKVKQFFEEMQGFYEKLDEALLLEKKPNNSSRFTLSDQLNAVEEDIKYCSELTTMPFDKLAQIYTKMSKTL